MITAENFIGQPGDKSLYSSTLELCRERMRGIRIRPSPIGDIEALSTSR
jgi:hypothetical protein